MRNNLNNFLLFFGLVLICQSGLYAQSSCGAPVSICSNPSFTFTSVGGTGLVNGLTVSNPIGPTAPSGTNSGCMLSNVPNPEWLLINVTSSGNLGFSFGAGTSPNPQTAALHWIMWPYNANTCANIFNNTLPPVACNYNFTFSGGTGMGPIPVGGSLGNYQPSIPVLQDEQYLICISNGTGVSPSVISFSSTGSAGISCNPLTVTNATACPGELTTVTATWLGASAVTYTLLAPPPTGGQIIQASPVFTISKPLQVAAAYVYTVLAAGINQYNQPITATQNFTLTINPTATIAVTHATNYCYDACASITVSPGTGTFSIAGPSTGPPAQTNSVISLCNLIAANNGNYTVSAQLNTGCVGSQTLQINVAPNNFFVTQPPPTYCQGSFGQLTATLVSANAYTWTGPNNFSVTVGPPFGPPVPNGDIVIANIQPSVAGVYTVQANINFNGITCLREATTSINVVQIHSVAVTPTYTYCQGSPVVLTGSVVNGTGQAYSWAGPTPAGVFYNSPTTPSVVLTNSILSSGTGNYVFTAYFTDGSLYCPVSANVFIQVVSVNPVTVLVPPQGLVCQYNTANLAVSAVGATSFTWSGPCGFTSTMTTLVIPDIQPQCSGFYTVDVEYTNGTVSCPASGRALLTVIPVNSITVVPEVVVCYPGNVGLYASAIAATGYTWSGPNTYTATPPIGSGNVVMYYPPVNASGLYTVTSTFTTGGLTCFNTNTVSVSINPIISFTLPSHLQVCTNGTLALDGPPGAVSYSWSASVPIPSLTPKTNQNLSMTGLVNEQSGTYALSVSSTGSCVSTRSVEVTVLTPITYTLPVQSRTLCLNDPPVRLEIGATGGSQVYAYNWFPGSYLSSPTGSVVYAHPLGTTVYDVAAIDVACPSHTIHHVFTLLVKQPPHPVIILDRNEGCEPFCISYNPKTQGEAAITTYDFGGVIKRQGDSLTNLCLDPGTYVMKVISEGYNGCIGTVEYPMPLVVHPKSRSDIAWTPELPTTTENLVTFNPVVKAGHVVSQSWMFTGTGALSEDTTDEKYPQRKYESTGKYAIMLISTTDKGCIDTTVKFIDIKDDLNVFIPNSFTPNGDGLNDVFQVKGLGFKVESFVLDIFDRWGHSIYTTKDINKGWDGNVKGQAPVEGVYVFRVRVIGANGEGRKEYMGHVTLLK